jgi:hypothetical protein
MLIKLCKNNRGSPGEYAPREIHAPRDGGQTTVRQQGAESRLWLQQNELVNVGEQESSGRAPKRSMVVQYGQLKIILLPLAVVNGSARPSHSTRESEPSITLDLTGSSHAGFRKNAALWALLGQITTLSKSSRKWCARNVATSPGCASKPSSRAQGGQDTNGGVVDIVRCVWLASCINQIFVILGRHGPSSYSTKCCFRHPPRKTKKWGGAPRSGCCLET